MITAGHETTAQALSWAMLLLAQHPAWADAARAQVLAVAGTTRALAYDDLAAMPLLGAVLWEAMRLYPPVPVITRVAVEDVTLEGSPAMVAAMGGPASLSLLAGTTVVLPIAAVHRDPSLWGPTADEFDPARFEGGVAAATGRPGCHPFAYLPFSHGPRNCVGMNFAMLEARLVLGTLLQKLEWALSPGYVHWPMGMITLRPKEGLPVTVWRRGERGAAA